MPTIYKSRNYQKVTECPMTHISLQVVDELYGANDLAPATTVQI